jgi:hypothetical protein
MALTPTTRNTMLGTITSNVTHFSLHTADPGTAGTAEVTGGNYARQVADWGTASAGAVATDAEAVFTVPGSTTITHIGYWSASTAGTFYGSRSLDASQTYATEGTYTLASGNITESLT